VQPAAGETRWRILRKETNDISGAFDPAAYLVHDGSERFLTDARLLVNGTPYHYAIFDEASAGVWRPGTVAAVTPASTFADLGVDAQELVRERIDVTLHAMIQRGLITLSSQTVPVMSIPFYTQGGSFPVVTVLFGNSQAVAHGLGDQVAQDAFDGDQWVESQGWLESTSLEVSVWSLNAEERNTLRRALKAVIAANLGILEEQGLNMVEVQSVQDSEDMQSMSAPIYQTVMRLGFQQAVAVTQGYGFFTDVLSTLGDY